MERLGGGEGCHEGPLLSSSVSIHTQISHFSQLTAFIVLHEKEALGQLKTKEKAPHGTCSLPYAILWPPWKVPSVL